MSLTNWLSERLPHYSRNSGPALQPAFKRADLPAQRGFRPALEPLEGRSMLSVLPVTSAVDDGTQGTLRYEVAKAQSGDTILLTSAIQSTGITLTQGELLLSQTGLTIKSASNAPVTISGNNTSRVLEVAGGADVTLSNLLITGGNGISNPSGRTHDGRGGGILVDELSTLTIKNSTVTNNSTAALGGGIADYGTLTVNNSTVSDNHALGAYGGGIAVFSGVPFSAPLSATLAVSNSTLSDNTAAQNGGGIGNSSSTVTVRDSTLSGNSTTFFDGGGIADLGTGTLTVVGSTLSGNAAGRNGGGIANFATAVIRDSTLSGNTAFLDGGGILNGNVAMATINNGTLSDNTATALGGGIANFGTATVDGTALSDNEGGEGGGIANFEGNGATGILTVHDTQLSQNTANNVGGALFNQSGTVTVGNSLLSGNVAANDGGGIYNIVGGTFTVRDSVLFGNSATFGSGGGIYNVGTLTVSGSTLSGNSAAENGGGIFNFATMKVSGSILSGNSAGSAGGGIYTNDDLGGTVTGTATVRDSIFSTNSPDNIFGPYDGKGDIFS